MLGFPSQYIFDFEMILHIPHSSRFIPDDIRRTILLPDNELETELMAMTDAYTDQLFFAADSTAMSVVYPVSRLVVDPERFLDDESEPMSERGMGVVYTKTSAGKPLRSKPEDFDKGQLIDRFYRPHHHKLLLACDAELKMQGSCLIVDCHSFPSRPLPYEQDQNSNRPDICIGTDEYHTPAWLSKLVTRLFIEQGYRVELNRPFSGTIVPSPCFHVNAVVTSVMVELNRHLYMNELNGEKSSVFDTVKGHLQMILQKLSIEHSQRM